MSLTAQTTFLEDVQTQLKTIVKPFQTELTARQKKAEFFKLCIRAVEKEDFFQLDELLKSKLAQDVLEDPGFQGFETLFQQLQDYADRQVDQYRIQFKGTLLQLAEENNLPIEVDMPRFTVLKGIEGEIDFVTRKTTLNTQTIKSIDPKRIVIAALKKKGQLYDAAFDAQKFIDGLFAVYSDSLKTTNQSLGEPISIRQLYMDYVISLQNKNFFLNMEKGKFKGYSLEQFAVDLWRYFQAGISGAQGQYSLRLNSGRGQSMWLIDQDGERRQMTHASFQKI